MFLFPVVILRCFISHLVWFKAHLALLWVMDLGPQSAGQSVFSQPHTRQNLVCCKNCVYITKTLRTTHARIKVWKLSAKSFKAADLRLHWGDTLKLITHKFNNMWFWWICYKHSSTDWHLLMNHMYLQQMWLLKRRTGNFKTILGWFHKPGNVKVRWVQIKGSSTTNIFNILI